MWIAHSALKPLPCKVAFGRHAAKQSALSLAYAYKFFLWLATLLHVTVLRRIRTNVVVGCYIL